MANKRQKPAELLQGKGSRHRGTSTLVLVAPDERRVVPRLPRGLGSVGRACWRAYWADTISEVATGADLQDIIRYCHLVDRRAELERKVADEPTVENEYGRQPNPLFKLTKELTREIEKTREQLGILPLARMRLGIATTQRAASVMDIRARLSRQPVTEPRAVAPPSDEVIDLEALS